MMATLESKTRNSKLISNLDVADNIWTRGKGLLGTRELPENQALWIHDCNSIHTFFMNYAIDCVFLTQDLRVISIKNNIKPWKMILPQWGAHSVVEMKAGLATSLGIKLGEELYVGN
jgi:uncharacterized membrane protein (UPF0127 family)